MIFGIGVDTVEIARFTRSIQNPRLRERLFTAAERELPVRSLAARFAAKEALIKALGGSTHESHHLRWHDMEIVRTDSRPRFAERPGLRAVCDALGVGKLHLSLTHDGGMATAMVVAQRAEGAPL